MKANQNAKNTIGSNIKTFAVILNTLFMNAVLITLFLMVQMTNSKAQMFTSDNAVIGLTAGATLTVQGDLLNKNGATMNNSGSINVSGNWTNNAGNVCFVASSGTVVLNGANQDIAGTSSTSFNNLTLQGSGTKTLTTNITVGGSTGILSLGTRPLDLNTHTLTVTNNAVSAITTTGGYLISEQANNSSKVAWNMASVAGAHVIPFGTASGVAIPFTYNQVSGSANTVTVSTYHTIPANTPFPTTPTNVTNLTNLGNGTSANAADRFWQVDPSGAGATANLTFTIDPATENPSGGGILLAQSWNNGLSKWATPAPTQSNPNAFTTVYSNVSVFGAWALARGASPLPIELVLFNAQVENEKTVACNWATASEINNDFFTIERSKDGQNFEAVGRVKGAGNSTSMLHYSFADENPYDGISYYRLKQTDFDGQFSYSQIEAVSIKRGNAIDFSVYPNPANQFVTLYVSAGISDHTTLKISDMNGKTVFVQELIAPADKFQLNVSYFAKGLYSCSLISGGNAVTKRLAVVH